MTRYAENTSVSTDRSLAEIERTLKRYGAPSDGFTYGHKEGKTVIGFEYYGKQFRVILPLPDPNAREFTMTPSGKKERTQEQAEVVWEQACRAAWRSLALVIKATLEAVEAGIWKFDDAFMAFRVLPHGKTMREEVGERLDAITADQVPSLLPVFDNAQRAFIEGSSVLNAEN